MSIRKKRKTFNKRYSFQSLLVMNEIKNKIDKEYQDLFNFVEQSKKSLITMLYRNNLDEQKTKQMSRHICIITNRIKRKIRFDRANILPKRFKNHN